MERWSPLHAIQLCGVINTHRFLVMAGVGGHVRAGWVGMCRRGSYRVMHGHVWEWMKPTSRRSSNCSLFSLISILVGAQERLDDAGHCLEQGQDGGALFTSNR